MKIYDIVLFLVILNLAATTINAMDVWAVPAELGGENMSEFDPETMSGPAEGFSIMGIGIAEFSIATIMAALGAGFIVSIFARVPTHQLIGIMIFGAFFTVLLLGTRELLDGFHVPDIMITLFLVLNGIVFVVGILQLATGVSLEHTA